MNKPFPPYLGDEPYMFVCYAHKDEGVVYPEIRWLWEQGINLWYDEGISAGKFWRREIAEAIQGASKLIYYISQASIESEECNREIEYALDKDLEIVPLYLEETELTPELDLALNRVQALHRAVDAGYRQNLLAALAPTAVEKSASEIIPANVKTGAGARTIHTPTIALLPLENVSGDPANDYLGEAMAHEIWDRLTQLSGLRLVSMRSSQTFKGTSLDIKEVAHQLTANYIVDGNINLSRTEVRISVHLIEAENGSSVWQEGYHRRVDEVADLFSVYDDVAARIGHELDMAIERQPPNAHSQKTTNLAAYNLIQRAKYANFSFSKMVRIADDAIDLDPKYGLARVIKAEALAGQAEWGLVRPIEGFERARQCAQQALELDPSLASAHAILGCAHDRVDLDFRKAMASYQLAEDLGATPGDLLWRQDLLLNAGHYDEGLAQARQWEVTDPISGMARMFVARFLTRLERIEEARHKFDEALQLSPADILVFTWTVRFYLYTLGDLDRTEAIISSNPNERERRLQNAYLALARGNAQPLSELVEDWVDQRGTRFLAAARISDAYYFLRDYQRHIEWFEIRVRERGNLGWIMDFLNYAHPDYWDHLNDWAVSDPHTISERLATIATHRASIDRITRKMVL